MDKYFFFFFISVSFFTDKYYTLTKLSLINNLCIADEISTYLKLSIHYHATLFNKYKSIKLYLTLMSIMFFLKHAVTSNGSLIILLDTV